MGRKQGHNRNQRMPQAQTRKSPSSVSTTTTDDRLIISYVKTQTNKDI
jgi:hypothetical protein